MNSKILKKQIEESKDKSELILEIKDLNLFYGGIHTLKDINLTVRNGEIITLIGANGAGKTSTLRAISSLEKIKSGSMSGVQSYAGYIEKDNKRYAFAIIVNHWNGERSKLRAEMEKLLNELFKK